MKKSLPIISFVLSLVLIGFFLVNLKSATSVDVTLFRGIMSCGIIVALVLSLFGGKGLWRKLSLTLSIIFGLFYFLGVELMRVVFHGNGF